MVFHRSTYCEDGFSNVRLTFTLDNYPNELLWEIVGIAVSGNIKVLKKGGPYETAEATIIEELCLNNDVINTTNYSCIGFRIYDLGLNGLRSPGYVGISVNGTVEWNINLSNGYENIFPVFGNLACVNAIKENSLFVPEYYESLHTECYSTECKWNSIDSVGNHGLNYNDDNKFLSISADGSILAIGNYKMNNNKGSVELLKNKNDGYWTQRGSITGDNADDWFGYSVSLSANGSSVAVGVPYSDANGIESGYVIIYMYNETNESWFPRGNNINGTQANSRFGWSVSLSPDGTVVGISTFSVIGTSCYVRVFEYDESKDDWIPRGDCLDGKEQIYYNDRRTFVKLASTGSVVATSVSYNNGNGLHSGIMKVLEYNAFTNKWKQIGSTG